MDDIVKHSIKQFKGQYRWLSNFWLSPVIFEGVVYPTVENAYQAAKLKLNCDRFPFINCSPGRAKEMGQMVSRRGWDKLKLSVMHKLLRCKFRNGSYLAEKLKATGNTEIIEGNDWGDTFWGVYDGVGENHLGKMLMLVRVELLKK